MLREGSHPNYWQTPNQEHPASRRKCRQRYRELTAHHVPDALALAAADAVRRRWEHLRLAAPKLPHLAELARADYPGIDRLPG
ncbi:MAG: hypothetical protein WKG07_44850 [Hymenobacter sp.]